MSTGTRAPRTRISAAGRRRSTLASQQDEPSGTRLTINRCTPPPANAEEYFQSVLSSQPSQQTPATTASFLCALARVDLPPASSGSRSLARMHAHSMLYILRNASPPCLCTRLSALLCSPPSPALGRPPPHANSVARWNKYRLLFGGYYEKHACPPPPRLRSVDHDLRNPKRSSSSSSTFRSMRSQR